MWEGTTNVLSLDVLRAVHRGEGVPALLARIQAAAELTGTRLPRLAGILASTLSELREQIAYLAKDPAAPAVPAGARGLALRLATALAAALMAEHAQWAA